MPQSEAIAPDPTLHGVVVEKLTRVFGPERGAGLLQRSLTQLQLPAIETTTDLVRLADLLQTRAGFEGTVGAMLSVMAAVRRSAHLTAG